jgi:hypothetical protein
MFANCLLPTILQHFAATLCPIGRFIVSALDLRLNIKRQADHDATDLDCVEGLALKQRLRAALYCLVFFGDDIAA